MESLRAIRLFVAAYEERSFSAAAEREHATQSGVSQHIRKLEARAGVRLFNRTTNTVSPTPAGDAYYRRALALLRMENEADRELRGFGGLDGEIVVGLIPWMARAVLAPALTGFIDRHPNVAVRVVEAHSSVLRDKVRAGEVSFAIVPGYVTGPGLASARFVQSPDVLVSASPSVFPNARWLPARFLDGRKFVLPDRETLRRRAADAYIANNGITPARTLELDSMLGTLDFVATTDWVSILPEFLIATDPRPERLTVHALADPPVSFDIAVISSAQRALSTAATAFLEALKTEAHRIYDESAERRDRGLIPVQVLSRAEG